MSPQIVIRSSLAGDKTIGGKSPVFTIAEIGLNHNGNIDIAKKMIDAAHEAGCSSVKFQNFAAEDVYIEGEKAGTYQLMGQNIPIYDLHKNLEITKKFMSQAKTYAELKGMFFFSAPMGRESLEDLVDLDVGLVKVASYEVSNLPWIREVANTNLPIIMSLGGASLAEVDAALNEIYKVHDNVAVMHCVIKYPAAYSDANLSSIDSLRRILGVPVGFSNNGFKNDKGKIDYLDVPTAAAHCGMDLYEVHITLDREMEGVDQGFSTEPHELRDMINAIESARTDFLSGKTQIGREDLMGSGVKKVWEAEKYVRRFAYKSVFTTRIVEAGERLTPANIKCLRPGEYSQGLEPKYYDILVENFCAKRRLEAFQPVQWGDLTS